MDETFEWDGKKNLENQLKHRVSFEEAQYAFTDQDRIVLRDTEHSKVEKRYFCIAEIKKGIITLFLTKKVLKN